MDCAAIPSIDLSIPQRNQERGRNQVTGRPHELIPDTGPWFTRPGGGHLRRGGTGLCALPGGPYGPPTGAGFGAEFVLIDEYGSLPFAGVVSREVRMGITGDMPSHAGGRIGPARCSVAWPARDVRPGCGGISQRATVLDRRSGPARRPPSSPGWTSLARSAHIQRCTSLVV